MKTKGKPGFTLVELLVVILIIIVVAAFTFTAVTKMLAKGKATKEMSNLRQMGPLFTIYATDNNMSLPPCKIEVEQPDGTTASRQWHEALLAELYPDADPADFKTKDWWNRNEPFIRNPLFKETAKPRGWSPLNPGYGLNEMIAENLAIAATGVAPPHEELLTVSTPLAVIAEPSRIPLVAPCDNYFYRYDDAELGGFKSGTLQDFLSEGKVPVLFVDGHVEAITPKEYSTRRLDEMPFVPDPEP